MADRDHANLTTTSLLHRRHVLGLGAGGLVAASGFGARAQSGGKPVSPPPSGPTGQVVIGVDLEPTAFNPLMPGIEVDEAVWMQIFSTLWVAQPDGSLLPDLAVEVPSEANGGISEGGLAWTVKLRKDAKWHDGTPFTAEDVKYTLELINNPAFKVRIRVGHALVKDIVIKSPHEISWRMEKVFSPYLALLSNTYIVPKHLLGKAQDPNTAPFNSAPVGTGPFKWGTRQPGDNITLVANPTYHGTGPYMARAILKYVPDRTALYAQFRTGQVDIVVGNGVPPNYYQEALKLPGIKVVKVPFAAIEVVLPNLENAVLKHKEVRQALYSSMNIDAMIDAIYYGIHLPTSTYVARESWAYNPNLKKHSYDPAYSNRLLDEAGWARQSDGIRAKNGVKLEFAVSTTTGSPLREQCQQLMQQDWLNIGARMKINNMPGAVLWGEFYTRSKFDSVMGGGAWRTVIDPDVAQRLSSTSIPVKTGSGANYQQFENSEVDRLLEEGQQTFDQEKRKAIYFRIQEIVRDELPVFPLFQYVPIEGFKENLVGYEPNINARINTWNMNTWYWNTKR